MSRAACYVRVSTERQTTENQLAEVQALCRARGFEPVLFEETESAAKERPVYRSMLEAVRRGDVRAVVVWSLDRLGRHMADIVATVRELDRLGVRLMAVRDSWMDTDGPARELLFAVFGWVAQFERSRLIERTRAGLTRAKAQGKRLGRPRAAPLALGIAARAVANGVPQARAAREAGVSERTLRRYLTGQKGRAPQPLAPDQESTV